MNALSYNGYQARIEFDSDDRIFFGHIAGINDIVGFHAESVADLEAAFHEAVDDYVETCAKIGKKPEKRFSGNLQLRVEPEKHARLALAAQLAGLSINQFTSAIIDEAMDRKAVPRVALDRQLQGA